MQGQTWEGNQIIVMENTKEKGEGEGDRGRNRDIKGEREEGQGEKKIGTTQNLHLRDKGERYLIFMR